MPGNGHLNGSQDAGEKGYLLGAKKTHIKKKHVNKFFTGFSRDFGGDFVYVFFSPIRNDPEKKKNT